jgi:hypothetical protein
VSRFLEASAQGQASCKSFPSLPSIFGHRAVVGFRPVRGWRELLLGGRFRMWVSGRQVQFSFGFRRVDLERRQLSPSLLPSLDSWEGGSRYVSPVNGAHCGVFVLNSVLCASLV